MAIADKIQQYLEQLPTASQTEVLDFAEYLLDKTLRREDRDWSGLSLASAMRGLEDEETPLYTSADLKAVFE